VGLVEDLSAMAAQDTAAAKRQTGHPSGDKRFKLLEVAMKRHQFRHDALIEVLHTAQGLFGYLDFDLLYFIAHHLRLPPSRVYGVATFYHLFSLKPKGQHACVVCMGTACYVKGADQILSEIENASGARAGETTAGGEVSVLTARCLGACGIAPVAVFDGDIRGNLTPESALQEMKGWLPDGPV
jgi:bidirectional [NiFe] hydrogenase diaphorase subunit